MLQVFTRRRISETFVQLKVNIYKGKCNDDAVAPVILFLITRNVLRLLSFKLRGLHTMTRLPE